MHSKLNLGLRLLLSLTLVWPLCTFEVKAGVDFWTSNGPEGGVVYALAVSRSNPDIVYAGTQSNGIYKSTNGGASWTEVLNQSTSAIEMAPSNPDILYTTNREELFKSTDGGSSWAGINSGLPRLSISSIAVDPTNPSTVYFGASEARLFKSTNGGASWVEKSSGLPGSNVASIAVDSSSPRTIYAGTFSGVYKSTDGGDSWQPARRGLGSAALDTVVIDPVHPNILYAATDSGIFQSLDGGQDWNELSSGITNESMSRIALNPSDTRSIYVSTVGSGVIQQQIRKPEIFSVNFEKKNLSIKGRNFGSISRILINNSDRSSFLVQGADGEIKLNGKAKKLKLKSGNNTIQVIRSDGRQSNTFTMTF